MMIFDLTARELHFARLLSDNPYKLTESDVISAGRIALGWRCDPASDQEVLVKMLANDARILTEIERLSPSTETI